MATLAYKEAYSEVLDILKHTKQEDVDKISPQFMEYLRSNASKTYISKLDHSMQIKDMNLKSKTRDILAIIYRKFWCNDEELKKFDEMLKENEKKYQERIKPKKDNLISDTLFDKKQNLFFDDFKRNENIVSSNTSNITKYKESFITKIINTIKSFFKK